jgi:hypothetical protein
MEKKKEAVEEQVTKFVTLEDILGKDQAELTALAQGEYETSKLGTVPFTALSHEEYKQAKKDCMKMVPNGTGGMVPDLDDDALMIKVIVAAVDKDERSSFTFANKALREKLGVLTADAVAAKLLAPGEIFKMAIEIQNISGFGEKAAKEVKDAVKNS